MLGCGFMIMFIHKVRNFIQSNRGRTLPEHNEKQVTV